MVRYIDFLADYTSSPDIAVHLSLFFSDLTAVQRHPIN
jgi:hypothetical protein